MSPRQQKMHEPINASFQEVLTAVADENKPATQETVARPFVKWAGSKRSLLPELIARLPEKYGTYRETFLGGAALFFGVRPSPAYLSDVNFPLVLAYIAVRDDVERVIKNLQGHASRHEKKYYLEMRKRLHVETDPTKIAGLLIYLNKTCYNGLYRVNQNGGFNVPMGSYKDPAILDVDNLRACSKALQGVEIWQHEFSQVPIREGDFYYLDPPYHGTFSGYDGAGFGDKDHEELAEFCKALHLAKCYFMVSNSDTPLIRKLYGAFNIEEVAGARSVSCKGDQRGKETELIIRNYGWPKGEQNGQPSGNVRRTGAEGSGVQGVLEP
jgi:DNA adenine methylase